MSEYGARGADPPGQYFETGCAAYLYVSYKISPRRILDLGDPLSRRQRAPGGARCARVASAARAIRARATPRRDFRSFALALPPPTPHRASMSALAASSAPALVAARRRPPRSAARARSGPLAAPRAARPRGPSPPRRRGRGGGGDGEHRRHVRGPQGARAVRVVPFICAGDPNLGATAKALKILDDAGADVIELGVPYSDPLADGPTIQCARHGHPDGTRPDPTRRGPRPRPPGDDERPRPSRPATARGSIDREPTLSEAAAVVRRARGGPVFFIARFGNRVGKRIPLAKKGFLLVGRRPRRFDRPLPLTPLRRRSNPPIARARRLATPDPERR